MQLSLTPIIAAGLLAISFTAYAEAVHPASIPDAVKQDILKRHSTAQDLNGSHETHFGERLLEVSYKTEDGQTIMELFTRQGQLFTSELLIEDIDEIQPAVFATLKQEFSDYKIEKAELIANPNGVGEEYEIYLNAEDRVWKVSITDQGVILDKQPASQAQNQQTKVIFIGASI